MRVVIAEDNLLVRAGIAALLRGAGIDVADETTGVEEVLEAVDAHRPDVAIVDIRMPRSDYRIGVPAGVAVTVDKSSGRVDAKAVGGEVTEIRDGSPPLTVTAR